MTFPVGMFRHPKTGMIWVRKDVPKALQPLIGKTSLKASLRTKDPNQARSQFHDVMRKFEDRIAAARAALAENRSMPFEPHFFQLDSLTPDENAAWAFAESIKPQNRTLVAIDRMERQLQQAGLSTPPRDAVSFAELFLKWKTERQPALGSLMEYERAKNQFVQLNGDRPISEYTVAHARAWKERVLSIRDAKGHSMAHATYVKIFGAIRTLFKYADRNDLLSTDPFAKIVLEKPKRPKKSERQDWDEDELQTLFSSPVYMQRKRPRGGDGEAAYWLPILALFHGLRAGELCQLDSADVVTRNKISCLRIAPSEEDEQGQGKSIKSDKSIRLVPIHARVIDLGFLFYVETIKGKKLFPLLEPDAQGRWSGSYSKWFGQYRRSLGLGERFKDFHSLRHTWKTYARGAKLPEEIHDEISGHDSGSVGRAYGKYPIPLLKKYVDKVRISVKIPKWTNEVATQKN